MLTRPPSCEGCTLHDNKIAIGFMSPEGTGSSGVLVVAEALGRHEAQDGLPLRPNAPAGSVFQGIIRRIPELARDQLLLSNTIWCQPGVNNWLDGAPYERQAIDHCQQYNRSLIEKRKPRAIVTLGAIPTRTITGLHGYNQGIKLVRGYIVPSIHEAYMAEGIPIPVIPTYHPSFLLRASKTRSRDKEGTAFIGGRVEKAEGGMALAGVVRRDIELALRVAKFGPPPPRTYQVIKGNRDVFDNLIREAEAHPELAIAWDIETPRSIDMADDESEIDSIQANVTQIQFALDDQRGFVFPGFDAEYVREGTRKLLALRNRKLSWNGWKFDNKVVSGHHGIPILGEDIDLMKAWRWIQPDLPQGLQYATSFYAPELPPWKHLAEEGFGSDWDAYHEGMLKYGACDVISLHINAAGIFKTMDTRGLRTSFDRHVLMLRTEMVNASHRGFPVDEEKHKEFGDKILGTITTTDAEIQTLIPEEILNVQPKADKKKKLIGDGYVGIPRQIAHLLDSEGNPLAGGDRVVLDEQVVVEDEEGNDTGEFETRQVTYVRRLFEVKDSQTLVSTPTLRWARLKPFSVGSPQQKIRYIQFRRTEEIAKRVAKGQKTVDAERLAKYVVPKVRNKQKELKDNTGAKELESLYKKTDDPVFKLLIEIGKLKKMHGTYIKGWHVKNGFVHTTFGLADTGTGQLSSTDPNIQNAPKHSALGKEFRGIIAAKPGKVLLEFDKKAFHAQTMAFEAKDKEYARLAAIDVHSYNAAWRLKLPEAPQLLRWSDKDLKAWFDMKKKEGFIYKSEACVAYPDGMTFGQVRDFKTKKVGLGINFCQGAASIYEQNPEGYKSKKDVQDGLDQFYAQFPKIKKFQTATAQLAHKQTYLITRWGYIRRFEDVFRWDPNKWNTFNGSSGDWAHGDDYEAAVAFPVANDAFGMLKEEMLRMAGYRIPEDFDGTDTDFAASYYKRKCIIPTREADNLLEKYGFCNQIHDSLFFHCDIGLQDECLENILTIMREPCLTLSDPDMAPNGLFVDASAGRGPDWASMKEVSV